MILSLRVKNRIDKREAQYILGLLNPLIYIETNTIFWNMDTSQGHHIGAPHSDTT